MPRIAQEGFVFIAAGPDTTARTMTCATYYLLANPEYLEQLRNELSTIMPTTQSKPDLRQLEELPFFVSLISPT